MTDLDCQNKNPVLSKWFSWYCSGSNLGQNLYLVLAINLLQRLCISSQLYNSPESHYLTKYLFFRIVICTQDTRPYSGWLGSLHWPITTSPSSSPSTTSLKVRFRKLLSYFITTWENSHPFNSDLIPGLASSMSGKPLNADYLTEYSSNYMHWTFNKSK